MIDLLLGLLLWIWSPPQREDRSIVGESRLDREARVFSFVELFAVIGIVVAVIYLVKP